MRRPGPGVVKLGRQLFDLSLNEANHRVNESLSRMLANRQQMAAVQAGTVRERLWLATWRRGGSWIVGHRQTLLVPGEGLPPNIAVATFATDTLDFNDVGEVKIDHSKVPTAQGDIPIPNDMTRKRRAFGTHQSISWIQLHRYTLPRLGLAARRRGGRGRVIGHWSDLPGRYASSVGADGSLNSHRTKHKTTAKPPTMGIR